MNILFYDMGSYTYRDMVYYLKKMGHQVKTIYYRFANRYEDAFFCERFAERLKKEHFDVVFSVNFFPLVATVCREQNTRYLSWSYDSPIAEHDEDYFGMETNQIFLFDRAEAERYQRLGFTNVCHLPLAVNTQRLDALSFTQKQAQYYSCDVSFVGNLYQPSLDVLLYAAGDYIKGYVEGIVQAQLKIYGYSLIEELVTDEITDAVNASFQKLGQTTLKMSRRGLAIEVAKEITHFERSVLIQQMGELFDTRIYSTETGEMGQAKECGPVKYYDQMPGVFRYSCLNLCPTIRCIKTGIPLRALDIMGAGGTLLANYQPELAEYFTDGESVILYESLEDAVYKADFYLKNQDLLKQIAAKGHRIVKEHFAYPDRIREMFEKAGCL